MVENTQEGSALLCRPKQDSLSLQKASKTALKHWVLHSKPVTPIRVDWLEFLLTGYDRLLKQFLVDGFSYGFCSQFVGERFTSESPNLKSALDRPDITSAKLHKECDVGRIVGPFTTPPFPNFCHYPKGSSIDDFITDYCSTVKYASVGDAIKVLKRLGKGCFMAKTDVKSAFCIIPIHPADYSLLGMRWDNMYYFDRCLAMRLSSSCAIFEAFSTALSGCHFIISVIPQFYIF